MNNMPIRDNFIVKGFFYTAGNHKFRKYLDIKHQKSTKECPDIMVVMMNPGSSRPENNNDNGCCVTKTVPDKTQDQIMKVMLNTDYQYARILNLSDLRTPKSDELYSFLHSNDESNIPHSIFTNERQSDFESLFIQNVPVIYGWGVNSSLQNLAVKAMGLINSQHLLGMLKEKSAWAYYHPLPPVYSKQKEWVRKVSSQLQSYKP